ncbi:MAG: DoxX family membrane protein [Luteitalea sp.]|nr:DoxX family membrane protein [Luteitalea sp.]
MPRNLDLGLLMLRLMLALILLYHGLPKLGNFSEDLDAFSKMGVPVPALSLTFAIAAEVIGGLLILVGVWIVVAAPLVIINMLGAIFAVHWKAGFDFTKGGYEHPLTVLVMALVLLLAGPGRYGFSRRSTSHAVEG